MTLASAGGPGALYVADQASDDVTIFVPPAPAAPTVPEDCETPQDVTADSVTLTGCVNANGVDTHYYFEYGPSTSYGSQVPTPPGTDIGGNYALLTVSGPCLVWRPSTYVSF